MSSRIRSTSFLPLNWKSKVNHCTNLDLVIFPMLSVSLSEGKFDLVVLTWNSDRDENFSLLQRWVSSLRSLYVISPLSNSKGFNFVFLRISRKTQMRGLWYWASFSISMSVDRKKEEFTLSRSAQLTHCLWSLGRLSILRLRSLMVNTEAHPEWSGPQCPRWCEWCHSPPSPSPWTGCTPRRSRTTLSVSRHSQAWQRKWDRRETPPSPRALSSRSWRKSVVNVLVDLLVDP